MKNYIPSIQKVLFAIFCLVTMLIFCAEPDSMREENMYEYEHFLDRGHMGWWLLCVWGVTVLSLIVLTIIRIAQSRE